MSRSRAIVEAARNLSSLHLVWCPLDAEMILQRDLTNRAGFSKKQLLSKSKTPPSSTSMPILAQARMKTVQAVPVSP